MKFVPFDLVGSVGGGRGVGSGMKLRDSFVISFTPISLRCSIKCLYVSLSLCPLVRLSVRPFVCLSVV